jgi:ParB family chromosome partitioning protein
MPLFKQVIEIPISLIELGVAPKIGRPGDEEGGIDELMASIKTHGLLQPIIVSQLPGGRYEAVAGTRRIMALAKLMARTVLAVVLTERPSPELAQAIWLNENLVREGLPEADLRQLFGSLLKKYGSVAAVAKETGLSAAKVGRYLPR